MTDKIEQPLFFPEAMLDHIQREAARLDRSMSWCVQKAWEIAGDRVAGLAPGTSDEDAVAVARRLFPEPARSRKQTLFFPRVMHERITAEASRQDRSFSWLVQHAYSLAIEEIAGIPSSE
jgi:uncharacterized small protein (TIGR04563 family)